MIQDRLRRTGNYKRAERANDMVISKRGTVGVRKQVEKGLDP